MGNQTCFVSAYNLNSQNVATDLLYPINTQNMTIGSKTFTFTYSNTGRQYLSFAFYISNHTNPLATRFFTIDNFTVKFTGNYPFTETVALYDGKDYRYGFNGMEKDDEVKGKGNSYDFGARMYDSRLGRFLSLDPKNNAFPFQSPFAYAGNNPIKFIDIEGEGPGDGVLKIYVHKVYLKNGNCFYLQKKYYDNVTPNQVNKYQQGAVTQNGWYTATENQYKNFGKNPTDFQNYTFGVVDNSPTSTLNNPQVLRSDLATNHIKESDNSVVPSSPNGTFTINATSPDPTNNSSDIGAVIEVYNLQTGEIYPYVPVINNNGGTETYSGNGAFVLQPGQRLGLRLNATASGVNQEYRISLTISTSTTQINPSSSETPMSNIDLFGEEEPVFGEDYNENGVIFKDK